MLDYKRCALVVVLLSVACLSGCSRVGLMLRAADNLNENDHGIPCSVAMKVMLVQSSSGICQLPFRQIMDHALHNLTSNLVTEGVYYIDPGQTIKLSLDRPWSANYLVVIADLASGGLVTRCASIKLPLYLTPFDVNIGINQHGVYGEVTWL